MKKGKKASSDKITIYKLPLVTKVLFILAAIGLTSIPILGIIESKGKDYGAIAMLLCFFSLLDTLIFFLVFKSYIRLDIKNNQFIIREFYGFVVKKIKLDEVKSVSLTIRHTINTPYFKTFTIDVVHDRGVYWVETWSKPAMDFTLAFNNEVRQIKRLEKFCEKCNQYLNSRQK